LFSCISSENNVEEEREDLALANATEKALQLRDNCNSIIKGGAKSGAEFFANRTYQGLNIPDENTTPQSFVMGRKGRAAGYEDENNKH
jgi:diphthamide biosynthesis protein 2